MKKILLILSVIGIMISCSDDNDSNEMEIDGTFTHRISDCDNSTNLEINCVEHIWFNDNSSANIMYGGIDYGIKFNYKINGDVIEFITENEPFSFRIESESVLIRIEDNEVWTKTE
ncbi:hypothetical protein JBL43_16620 [Aureibaculum sp. A20]|uniref:Uncharacterized protein n=1 Tax=Aureibaculum flavum TaxID=2795986 RepID=A0ABS0WV86_9FLAO|nr:hypothetical protein [Aureibaculum flavum]MBJ2175880.1 hypothetical protein [Aureibaculum flavum]